MHVVKLNNSNVHNMNIRKLHNTGENFLTESGVYKLVFKSNKENAERFQDWVCGEVLPSIRIIEERNSFYSCSFSGISRSLLPMVFKT